MITATISKELSHSFILKNQKYYAFSLFKFLIALYFYLISIIKYLYSSTELIYIKIKLVEVSIVAVSHLNTHIIFN